MYSSIRLTLDSNLIEGRTFLRLLVIVHMLTTADGCTYI